jgi:hypothetical protein
MRERRPATFWGMALLVAGLLAAGPASASAPGPAHPALLIKAADVPTLRQSLGQYQLLDKSYRALQKMADKALASPIAVPMPKDPAGGYTHEQHTRNYYALQAAGICFQMTKDGKYARFVRDMLLEYSKLIPGLKNHPEAKSSSPGRLFHQALNDCNWLVYSVQGYDAVYETLTPTERKQIEDGAFRPLCTYITKDLKSWFDLVHNHGVWAAAAVGMTGYALHDTKLTNLAVHGSAGNDKSGFLAQLNGLFSPDGYYTEGPYYSRYALSPFFMFAQAIDNNQPELHIFEYRGSILKKALNSSLQLTNTDGRYYPLNDALKEKDWTTQELIGAISIAAQHYGVDKTLLGLVQQQGKVLVAPGGLAVAKAVQEAGKNLQPYQRQSVLYTDGPTGSEGGLAVLRAGAQDAQTSLIFKYTSHGLSHGHYDKLGIVLYDRGREVLQDYGAVRFLNVEAKEGGRYLPETKTWASQTVAHNTLVVDEASDFGGKEEVAEKNAGQAWFADIRNANAQVVSAKANSAYPGVQLQRTVALVLDSLSGKPLVLDVFRVQAAAPHQYDLPWYYQGQLISTSFKYDSFATSRQTVGLKNGYQHLWREAVSQPVRTPGVATLTWLNGPQFYSLSTATDTATHLVLARIGATDPNFNLRPEPALLVREKAQNKVFVSVLESHGEFNPTSEVATGSRSNVARVAVLFDSPEATVVEVQLRRGGTYRLAVANQDAAPSKTHEVAVAGQPLRWQGPYQLRHIGR